MNLQEYIKVMTSTDRVEVVYWDESKSNLITLFNQYVYNIRSSKAFKTYSKYEIVAVEPMDKVSGEILYIRRIK